jgi:hypothetical protein
VQGGSSHFEATSMSCVGDEEQRQTVHYRFCSIAFLSVLWDDRGGIVESSRQSLLYLAHQISDNTDQKRSILFKAFHSFILSRFAATRDKGQGTRGRRRGRGTRALSRGG